MKRHWKIVTGLVVLTVVGVWLLSHAASPALRDLDETRRALRRDGFKLDLREFNFALSPELSRRAASLARTTRAATTNRVHPFPIIEGVGDLPHLTPVGKDAAIPTWTLGKLKSHRDTDLWAELGEKLKANQARLEAARQAAVSGPIRFEPIGSRLPNPLLPYLADLKSLASTFEALTMLALRNGDRDAAWTNLFAVTCLATGYSPEPIDISHLVRLGCVDIACDATWNALQAPGWTEAQLALLQRRWKTPEFWSHLPETAAYSRASMAAICQLERRRSLLLGMTIPEAIRHPKDAWSMLAGYWSQGRYQHRGSYEDEKALLLHYRDRELELRRAVQAKTWAEMRRLPGVTNFVPFVARSPSRATAMLNLRQMNLAFQGRGVGLAGRAAEAEARRSLVVTALALERYRRRHDRYPDTLSGLVPELLQAPPVDFMDGQPLRYRLTQDGHFVLYSVGLDCVDNGGQMRQPRTRGRPYDEFGQDFGFPKGTDLVWPRQASAAEVQRFQEEEKRAEEARTRDAEEAQAEAWWNITTRRQSNVEKALAAPVAAITTEPVYGGHRLSELLLNRPGTNQPSLMELLTLKQVVTGEEPETVAFELPIRYESLTNLGELVLCIDRYGPDYEEGWAVGHSECVRATNGDCRLVWSTIYETLGKHALLAGLDLKDKGQNDEGLFGPVTPFVVTNLCQFTPESAFFNPELGAKFYARLPESNGTYQIELESPAGERLRTITGSTTNGFFEVHWDLTDDHGRRCTNDSYDSVFHITLPDSGRSQTLNGP
jgi:hypothetical protein